MNWKIKNKVQQVVALFPEQMSNRLYYWLQRHYGRLKSPFNPICPSSGGIEQGISMLNHIRKIPGTPGVKDKIFFEIGTGWIAMVL